jgi:hypothetical protein
MASKGFGEASTMVRRLFCYGVSSDLICKGISDPSLKSEVEIEKDPLVYAAGDGSLVDLANGWVCDAAGFRRIRP